MEDKTSTINGAEYTARTLHGYKTTHIFFVEAILRMVMKEAEKLGVKGIMAHSENAAGYMADGYARASGRPGVCFAQSIGAANLAAGLGDAWLGTSPVIAFTGKKPPDWQYKNAYQELDHHKMFEAVTKFNADMVQDSQLPFLLRQCYKEAVTGKPHPVHLDVPGHTGRLLETAEISEPLIIEENYSKYPPFRTAADATAIKEAAEAINKAERPLLVSGRGAAVSDAGEALCRLAKKGDIPVVTTPDGKTTIDESDPLWAGIIGFYGMNCANKAAANSDLVIFIGTQASDQTTNDWLTPPRSTKTVHIDIHPAEPGKNYPDCIGLHGDARTVLLQLYEAIREQKRPSWCSEVRTWTDATLSAFEKDLTADTHPIMPERLCREVEKALPDDAVLVSDTGYSAVWTSIMIRMKQTQKYIRAAGSLGWGFPGSLGVKCGLPDRPVICFTGDGGFYYHMNEMETAVKYGINTVTVLNNNRTLAQGIPNITTFYPEGRQIAIDRITYPPVRFTKIAEEMGCFAVSVSKPEDIAPAIEKALRSGRPGLVEVLTFADRAVPDPMNF